jgi:alkylated DNA repair protein (DNA oxidative demethylase)
MIQGAIAFAAPQRLNLGPGTFALPGYALVWADEVIQQVAVVAAAAPWRHMVTPGGARMSVAMTNCGALGWVSDTGGYRYSATDPLSGRPWPTMPEAFMQLAFGAAEAAGWPGFVPDACLINRYGIGARLTLHQDRNEADFGAPIVSVSLGVPAIFLLGGAARSGPNRRLTLTHGDVLVWGGADRLRYHGVAPLRRAWHPAFGEHRVNLTFRRAS